MVIKSYITFRFAGLFLAKCCSTIRLTCFLYWLKEQNLFDMIKFDGNTSV